MKACEKYSGITTATTAYSFVYDNFGNTTSISAGDNILATYSYNSNNGKLASMKYGNDTNSITYQYDALDRLEKVCYNGNVKYEYQYTSDGKLHCVNDYQSGVGYLYGYNVEGKLSEYVQYDLDDMTNTLSIFYTYNDRGQIEQVFSSIDYLGSDGSKESYHFTEYYAYDELDDMTHLLQQYSLTDILETGFEYDEVQRLTKKTIAVNGTTDYTNVVQYTYADRNSGKLLSSQVETYSTQVGGNAAKTYTYTYDANGNITKIVEEIDGNDDKITQYTYDNLGQLIREDNPYKNTSYVYAYDNNGNRTSVATYTYTTGELGTVGWIGIYTYGDDSWGDLLTMYCGSTITYDAIGNPLSYYNGTRYNFTWTDGRRLTSATKTNAMGGTMGSYSFTYNDEGIRTSKASSGVTHYYTLDGSRIVSEEWGNYFAVYLYDESGAPIGMQIRQSSMADGVFHTYYFEKNLQGDIIGVYNSSGALVYSYVYDAWGNFKATKHISSDTFASYNPFRYRGYYYDTDFGFYYLNSRYYDPITGRFLNADNIDVIGATPDQLTDKNLFSYCDNNPITRVDGDGEWWNVVIGAAIGGTINLVSSIISEVLGDGLTWDDAGKIAASTAIGLAEGALTALCPAASAAISAVANAADTAIIGFIENDSVGDIITNSLISGALGAVTGSGGSDFVKGGKLINDAMGSVGNVIGKGVHPVVKKTSRETIKKAIKVIGRSYVSGQIENFAYGGIREFSSRYIGAIVSRYGGN